MLRRRRCRPWASGLSRPGELLPGDPYRRAVPGHGITDQLARRSPNRVREVLGQTVIVENKPEPAAPSVPTTSPSSSGDGYTLRSATAARAPPRPDAQAALRPQKDFRPISGVMRVPMILAVPADSPHKSVAEFVAWARSGRRQVNYGSTGVGGASHLYSEYCNELARHPLPAHPLYRRPAAADRFRRGQVQMAFVTGWMRCHGAEPARSATWRWRRPSGRQCCRTRLPSPRAVPGFQAVGWFGVLAPAGVPDPSHRSFPAPSPPRCAAPRVSKFLTDRNVELGQHAGRVRP